MITPENTLEGQLGLVVRLGHLVLEESVLTLLFIAEDAAPKEPCNQA
jgi:hypothetical protein